MKKHFAAPVLRVEAALAALTLQTGSGAEISPFQSFTTEPPPPPPPTSGGKNG